MATEVCTLDWHVAPWKDTRWLELWEPAAARMPSFGAKDWSLTRSIDDPLHFRQTSVWESRGDFERYWYSNEIEEARAAVIDLHDIPLKVAWHTLVVSGQPA